MSYYDNTDPAYKNFIQQIAVKVIDLCVDESLSLTETADALHIAIRSAEDQKQIAKLGRVKPEDIMAYQRPVPVVSKMPVELVSEAVATKPQE